MCLYWGDMTRRYMCLYLLLQLYVIERDTAEKHSAVTTIHIKVIPIGTTTQHSTTMTTTTERYMDPFISVYLFCYQPEVLVGFRSKLYRISVVSIRWSCKNCVNFVRKDKIHMQICRSNEHRHINQEHPYLAWM